MASPKPRTLGLLLEGLEDEYERQLYLGASAGARECECRLVCFSGGLLRDATHHAGLKLQRELLTTLVGSSLVDGLVVPSMFGNFVDRATFSNFLHDFALPLTSIGHVLDTIPYVEIDNGSGIELVFRHLVEVHGARRIAFFKGPAGDPDAQARCEAFSRMLSGYGLAHDERLMLTGDFSRTTAAKAMHAFVEWGMQLPDAVVCANDGMAIGVIEALGELGVNVPGDILVSGFDNSPDARHLSPELTTVDQPFAELSRRATLALVAQLSKEPVDLRITVEPTLCIRESCGCQLAERVGNPHRDKAKELLEKEFVLSEVSQDLSNLGAATDIDELKKALNGNPNRIPIKRFRLALTQQKNGRWAEVQPFYERALPPIDPTIDRAAPVGIEDFIRDYLAENGDAPVMIVEQLKAAIVPVGLMLMVPDEKWLYLVTPLRNGFGQVLQSIDLIAKVQRQADELAQANTQLVTLRAHEQEYLDTIRRELDLARQIQADFLPGVLPKLPGWDIAFHFQPAQEVAGDFYDVFMLGEETAAVVVADVCGKSVGAAIFMALVRSLLRALAGQQATGDPLAVVSYINDYIFKNHNRNMPSMFVTLFYGVIDVATGAMRYVNAGHPPPAICHNMRKIEMLKRTGPAVGIHPDGVFNIEHATLMDGDLLFAYTDGVTEAQDTKGVLLGKKSLYSVIEQQFISPASLIDSVKEAVLKHSVGNAQSDDITMLAIKRIG